MSPFAASFAGFTWILAYEDQADAAKGRTLAYMLEWATHDAQRFAADLDYAMLSPAAQQAAEAQIKRLKSGGQQLLQ